jgi:2',3'-cyclic-nucleotide 2'-phosphodiesterase (5'-nucleotidase family)
LAIAALVAVMAGCASGPEQSDEPTMDGAAEVAYTLQLLHFADIDGNEEQALQAVDEFSALVNAFRNDPSLGAATLLVSSGDNIIPGPRYYAAEQRSVRALTGSNEPGHADVAIMNALGLAASAVGNHDLDTGPGELVDAIGPESTDSASFPGALFPYLSANLDFSTDEDTAELIGTDGDSVEALAGKFAASAVATVNGERIGLVGASTPTLPSITSTGGIGVTPKGAGFGVADLAKVIQPAVDELIAAGVNKVIVLSHMQQIAVEQELATLLRGVDIIVAGGSNTRMGDSTDVVFSGDDGFQAEYPNVMNDADGMPIVVVNVDGDYKYLGRLVVGFDAGGTLVLDSLDQELNGAWASNPEVVAGLGGIPIPEVVAVRDKIQEVIAAQFGNVVGYTSVYLDGRRSQVRTQETNLGNLTADANLWYANLLSRERVDVAIKNGGGIRTEIGAAVVPPGSVDYASAVLLPPPARDDTGTAEGAISEGHLRATLRFDNGLALLTATANELKGLMEHAVADTAPGRTPGRFPQIGGMRIDFDASAPAGSRIRTLEVLNDDGTVRDTVVSGGSIQGTANRTFRLVTLNFLANGGDGYPFGEFSRPNRVNLYEGTGFGEDMDYPDANLSADPGRNSGFSYTGGEQDALAEYLLANHATPARAFDQAETDRAQDTRIRY